MARRYTGATDRTMPLLRHCLICLLMCLLAPWASAQAHGGSQPCHGAHAHSGAPSEASAPEAAPAGEGVHAGPAHPAAASAAPLAASLLANAQASAHCKLPCKDCSACHVVALLPAIATVCGPEPMGHAPLWTPSLSPGRARVCELYRPPQA